MQLISFGYEEWTNTPKEWCVEDFKLGDFNLFVGRNGSGKSRLMSAMFNFGVLLVRPPNPLWDNGHFRCILDHDGKEYSLEIEIRERTIRSEWLKIDGKTMLERDDSGGGRVFSEKINDFLDFKIKDNSLALNRKRDEVQHPYIEPLMQWAESSNRYLFGTDFGKSRAFAASKDFLSGDSSPIPRLDPNEVVAVYADGYRRFKGRFDEEILSDFANIGYPCERIDSSPLSDYQIADANAEIQLRDRVPMHLSVKEKDLPKPTFQNEMSMGMFRALALVININYAAFSGNRGSIMVDDIGEGLDFERSSALISMVQKKCRENGFQAILATNDRFIMNEVSIRNWHIIHRSGNLLRIMDFENSKDVFERFEFLGLTNFDFFTSQI